MVPTDTVMLAEEAAEARLSAVAGPALDKAIETAAANRVLASVMVAPRGDDANRCYRAAAQ
jgi:hypothetical protein